MEEYMVAHLTRAKKICRRIDTMLLSWFKFIVYKYVI